MQRQLDDPLTPIFSMVSRGEGSSLLSLPTSGAVAVGFFNGHGALLLHYAIVTLDPGDGVWGEGAGG